MVKKKKEREKMESMWTKRGKGEGNEKRSGKRKKNTKS